MARTSESRTSVLPNGNRVTVTVGQNRSGTFKKVSVQRRDGTADSRTYRRGLLASELLGGLRPYDLSIPDWAKRGGSQASKWDRHLEKMAASTEASKRRGAQKTLAMAKEALPAHHVEEVIAQSDDEAERGVADGIRIAKNNDPARYRRLLASLPAEDRERMIQIEKKYGI